MSVCGEGGGRCIPRGQSEINKGRGRKSGRGLKITGRRMGTSGKGRNGGVRTGKDARKREREDAVDLQMFPWVSNKSSRSICGKGVA